MHGHVTSLKDHFEGFVELVAGNYTTALHSSHSRHRRRTDLQYQPGAEIVQFDQLEERFAAAGPAADYWDTKGR